jgi:hypothetical protein
MIELEPRGFKYIVSDFLLVCLSDTVLACCQRPFLPAVEASKHGESKAQAIMEPDGVANSQLV